AKTYHSILDLKFPNKNLVVDCHDYQLIVNSPRQSVIGRSIYETGVWEADVTEFISDKIQPGWTIFDIGSHIGYYSLLFAKHAGKTGQVHCFEPSQTIETLRQNAELNQWANLKIHDFALFDREGTICMEQRGKTRVKTETSEQDILVEMKIFDEWKKQANIKSFDLFKLDVEGAEFNILQGMKETIEEFKPAILIEVHTEMLPEFGFSASEVFDFLRSANYKIAPVDQDEITFANGNITLYCQ
ncbi:MAG: FkbM family methyltransferase, partial [Cyanobacteria bacterium J06555_3]